MTPTTLTAADRHEPDMRAVEISRRGDGRRHFNGAAMLFSVLDPVPYGFFVGACIFDAIYASSAEVLWFKAAAWLISIGLLFAIVPRLINLAHVWFPRNRERASGAMSAFWLNLFAIVAAIVNAFVHSRDAYGVMPEGLWLSCVTVLLMVLSKVVSTLQKSNGTAS